MASHFTLGRAVANWSEVSFLLGFLVLLGGLLQPRSVRSFAGAISVVAVVTFTVLWSGRAGISLVHLLGFPVCASVLPRWFRASFR